MPIKSFVLKLLKCGKYSISRLFTVHYAAKNKACHTWKVPSMAGLIFKPNLKAWQAVP